VFTLRRVTIRVDEQIIPAVVRGLEWGTWVNADESADWNIDPLGRLPDIKGQRSCEDDKRLLLHGMPVASSFRPGLVAPDVAADMREAESVAQFGDMPRRLTGLMGAREPLKLRGPNHVVAHRASLSTPAWASVLE
jgi:hypothetical protein